jgi:nucleotide-binding universal stress UspA family protein
VRTLLAKANAGDGPLVRVKLVFGRAFEEISREGTKADLVVLGRHGSGGFAALLLGSTAERVVRTAVAPVLVVAKAPTHDSSPARGSRHVGCFAKGPRVLPASRSGRRSARDLPRLPAHVRAERALRRAGYSGGELVKQRREERAQAAKALRGFLKGVAGGVVLRQCRQRVRSGDPRFALLDRAKRRRADLIVVGSQGRSAIARMFLGSVAEAVLRNATCDVLETARRAISSRGAA